MGRPSGLRTLVEGVQAYFKAQAFTAVVDAGWKRRTYQLNEGEGGANRVVFCPGDANGNIGELHQPRLKTNPRSLRQLDQLITVCAWSVDTSNVEDELTQQDAVENFLDVVFQGIQSVAKADWVPGAMKETRPGGEMQFGRERLFQMILKQEFFDVTLQTVTATPAITRQMDPPGGSSG